MTRPTKVDHNRTYLAVLPVTILAIILLNCRFYCCSLLKWRSAFI